MTHMTLQAVRQLIANDSYAITFQSLGQYRTALLRHFDNLVEAPITTPAEEQSAAFEVDIARNARSAPGTTEAPADMRAAADFIDKRAEQYLQDHASHEPDTGAVSFHYGEAGRDYHSTLVELADDLRQASKPAVCAVPPAGWHCTRAAGHEGPCAAVQRAAQLDGGQGEERSNVCRPAT